MIGKSDRFFLVLRNKVSKINRLHHVWCFHRYVRGSSKGRTGVFGTSNLGSNPSPRAIQKESLSQSGKAFFLKDDEADGGPYVSLP
jgi:hypothetical protein